MKSLRLFLQLTRPVYLLTATLLFFLGAGINRFINGPINWSLFSIGFFGLVFILLGFQYLNEYFEINPAYEITWWHTPFSGGSGAIGPGKLTPSFALWAGLTCLTVAASMTVLLLQFRGLNSLAAIILVAIVISEILFVLPPFHLITSGYGEILMSIIQAGLIPAFAYVLQGDNIHRIVIMVALPLVTLFLSMLFAFEFPGYAADIKYEKKPIIVKIGWQKAMQWHNILILLSFVLIGLAFYFGLPFTIGWPVLLVLPVAIFQIWMMNRIGEGAKPNWNLLVLSALSTFGLATYILSFSFWTH